MRTDVAPGIKVASDIVKARGLISGGLGPDDAKDLLTRLGLEEGREVGVRSEE